MLHSTTPGMFAAGADIAELIERDADAALRAINADLFERVEAHRWPTIAADDRPPAPIVGRSGWPIVAGAATDGLPDHSPTVTNLMAEYN